MGSVLFRCFSLFTLVAFSTVDKLDLYLDLEFGIAPHISPKNRSNPELIVRTIHSNRELHSIEL